jgi:hypothetical protein
MKGEAGDHGFSRLRVLLVKDEVADAVIYWHFPDSIDRLENVRMMTYDGSYTSLGKTVGKGSLTDAWIGLKFYSPMQHHHDVGIGMFTAKMADFIEQFILRGLSYSRLVVNSTPVLYRESGGIEQSHAYTILLNKDRRHLFLEVAAIA